jgi:hypothetical protein
MNWVTGKTVNEMDYTSLVFNGAELKSLVSNTWKMGLLFRPKMQLIFLRKVPNT